MAHEHDREKYVIDCEAHTTDNRIEVDFDAAPWFENATDEKIAELRAIRFGGEPAADELLKSHAGIHDGVRRMLAYLSMNPKLPDGELVEFECHVDEQDAESWIAAHRPHLIKA